MNEIDFSQYRCEKCQKLGVVEEGMDVFVACLCRECFDKIWDEYVLVMTRPPRREEKNVPRHP